MNRRPIQSIIACEVEPVLSGREWRHEYMTLQLRDQENREIGREEGRVEGREEGRVEGYKELMGRK